MKMIYRALKLVYLKSKNLHRATTKIIINKSKMASRGEELLDIFGKD